MSIEPTSLNPLLVTGQLSPFVSELFYSYLFIRDAQGRPVPEAATEVPTIKNGSISRDGLKITYHLRPGIRWQDGFPLTAADCVFTFHAIMNPRNNLPGREGYDQIAAVAAPNPTTIVVRLRRSFANFVPAFLSLDTNYPILPAHIWSKYPDLNQADFSAHLVGSGPFKLVAWRHGDRIEVAANDDYFQGRPAASRISFKFVPSETTVVNELQTHEIDMAPEIHDPLLVDQLQRIDGLNIVATPLSGIDAVLLNTASLTSRQLRSAIIESLNIPLIVDRATRGHFHSRNALRGYWGEMYSPATEQSFNPAKARSTLDDLGWHTGVDGIRTKDGQRLQITLISSTGSLVQSVIATQIQAQLRSVGILVNIRLYDRIQFFEPPPDGPFFGGKFDLAVDWQVLSPLEAGLTFTCAQKPPSGFNVTRLCDPKFDADYESSLGSYDPVALRRADYAMERELDRDVTLVPLYQLRNIAALSAGVSGFEPSNESPYVNMWKWSKTSLENVER
ncbi:MAG: peptide ABC transporter substrate-binding protein [Vulcanimicrobiaceae bacterium]|jgi:peptide/nickel transport system substrate-binding protein